MPSSHFVQIYTHIIQLIISSIYRVACVYANFDTGTRSCLKGNTREPPNPPQAAGGFPPPFAARNGRHPLSNFKLLKRPCGRFCVNFSRHSFYKFCKADKIITSSLSNIWLYLFKIVACVSPETFSITGRGTPFFIKFDINVCLNS